MFKHGVEAPRLPFVVMPAHELATENSIRKTEETPMPAADTRPSALTRTRISSTSTRRSPGEARQLPAGISERLQATMHPRLLDELHLRDASLAQQAQLIHQLQTALQRAHSTNQELALIADRVSDAILICDTQRCITWVNPPSHG